MLKVTEGRHERHAKCLKYFISNISNQQLKVYAVYEESKYIYILQPQNFMLNQSPSIHPVSHEVESKRLEP